MKKRCVLPVILSLSIAGSGFAQQTVVELARNIPESHRAHPELGQHLPQRRGAGNSMEMVHLRTPQSRTFLHTDGTMTSAYSSEPMHHLGADGLYHTLDHSLAPLDAHSYGIPAQEPTFTFDTRSHSVTFLHDGDPIMSLGGDLRISTLDASGEVISSLSTSTETAELTVDGRTVRASDVLPMMDVEHLFLYGLQKTNLIIREAGALPQGTHTVAMGQRIWLPNEWQAHLSDDGLPQFIDPDGTVRIIMHPPVVRDSKEVDKKFPHERPHTIGTFALQQTSGNDWLLTLAVDGHWLTSAERVYPVIIDPSVSVTDLGIMPSCFLPEYQQGTLTLEVPNGETIFDTYLEWNFVAVSGTQAWMSDQRSFVSGPNGQTPVFNGSGSAEGTYNYVVNGSDIANGISTGQMGITFNAARDWGGSGCNAAFNFISRRYVEIAHGNIEFGDGQVVINEYSCSNRSMLDGFGRTEDWVELYNPTDAFTDLSGYHLSDDAGNPTKWQITSGFIPPQGRVLVYCSGRDISSGSVLHAGFRLTQLRPEDIVLADPDGNVLESYTLWRTQNGHSYGRVTDGADEWGVFANPTPLAANTGAAAGYASTPALTPDAGHYATGQTVTITAGAGEQVRYTTNGSEPTASSPLYTGPINVSSTTVIRARSFRTDLSLLPGFMETNTYLINENHALPVFSFSGNDDMNQLFGGDNSLEPIGAFEFFDENGTFVDESVGDFDKHGNDSWNYPQRGVDFVSRDDYGYNRHLTHPFFATSNRTRFQRLMVKAAANDNYPHETGGAHIRDSYVQTLSQLSSLDLDERSSTNVVVYVNGAYWGVYDLREKVDDRDYTDFYYGQDREYGGSDLYIQFLKTWGGTEAKYGNQPAMDDWASLRQFVANNDMADPANFAQVDELLNISSLIDYFVINSFVVSRDWLNYNTGWWRGLDPTGDALKWRYILWDQEGGLGHYVNFTGMPDVTANAAPCQVENLTVSNNGHVQTISKLINENPDVRQRYVTRYADLLNTHFSCERIIEVLDSMVGVIEPEMPRQIARWGGSMAGWLANVQQVRNFLNTRCSALVSGLANCYDLTGPFACTFNVELAGAGRVKMNSEWLNNLPFTANVFGNIATLVTAQPFDGFEFSHWTVDGTTVSPSDQSIDISLMLSQAVIVTAHFINPFETDDELIHYWHFNNLETPDDVTSIAADFTAITDATPTMTYTGSGGRDIDVYNTGSVLNLHQMQPAGRAARVRNPSGNRSLVFDIPSTGYQNIRFEYAVHRSGQGMLTNVVAYSLDGSEFTQEGLEQTEYEITEDYAMVELDLTGIEGVRNNPDLKMQITFVGNTTASNGNNRFDNITVKGDPYFVGIGEAAAVGAQIRVYPNPANDLIYIHHPEAGQRTPLLLTDLSGRTVAEETMTPPYHRLHVGGLVHGIYLLRVGDRHFKVVVSGGGR